MPSTGASACMGDPLARRVTLLCLHPQHHVKALPASMIMNRPEQTLTMEAGVSPSLATVGGLCALRLFLLCGDTQTASLSIHQPLTPSKDMD